MNHLHIIPVGGAEPIHVAHSSCWCHPTQDAEAPANHIHHSKEGREHREARNLPTEPGSAWVTVEEAVAQKSAPPDPTTCDHAKHGVYQFEGDTFCRRCNAVIP